MNCSFIAAAVAAVILSVFAASAAEVKSLPLPKGYGTWKKSERKVVTDKNSLFYGIHYLYADTRAFKGYQAGNKFDEGSRIVVDFLQIRENPAIDGPRSMIVMMQKDRRRTETGGWLFASYGADGKPSGIDPARTCFSCHQKDAAQRDFVISTIKDFTR